MGIRLLILFLLVGNLSAYQQQSPTLNAGGGSMQVGNLRAAGDLGTLQGPAPLAGNNTKSYPDFRGLDFDRRGPVCNLSAGSTDSTRIILTCSATDNFTEDLPGWGNHWFDGQYCLDGGAWSNWFSARIALSDTFGPTLPDTLPRRGILGFRVRGTDNAWNVGPWTEPVYYAIHPGGQVGLMVRSQYGNPTPPVGVTWFDPGTPVHAEVDSSVTVGGRTYICYGWSGGGSVPAFGSERRIDFTITGLTTINWLWADAESLLFLDVVSLYGNPVPPVGRTWYGGPTLVRAAVESTIVRAGRTYRCIGWRGWGSVPSTGAANSVSFTVTLPSRLEWRWMAADSAAIPLTVYSVYGHPTPPRGISQWAQGSVIDAWAEDSVDTGGYRYYCTGWTGSGSVPPSGTGSRVTFSIDTASTLTWLWNRADSFVTLTVISPYGNPSPSGTTRWSVGRSVGSQVTSPVAVDSMRRWVCDGWSVSHSGNPTGLGTRAAFIITEPCTLRFAWSREYRLALIWDAPGGYHPIQTGFGWYAPGDTAVISTEPFYSVSGIDYAFTDWTSQPAGAPILTPTSAGTGVVMDSGYVLTAHYISGALPCVVRKSPLQGYGGFTIDGISYTGTGLVNVRWLPGTTHYVTATSPDESGNGRRYLFRHWVDGDSQNVNHAITMGADTFTLWAYYDYLLACSLRVAPAHRNPHLQFGPVSGNDTDRVFFWAKADSSYTLSVTDLVPFGGSAWRFLNWNDMTSTPMRSSGRITVPTVFVANFERQVRLTLLKSPAHSTGYIYYNGVAQTGVNPRGEYVPPNRQFTIGVSTEDPLGADSLWIWDSWSDGGLPTHTVVVDRESTFVAAYHSAALTLGFDIAPLSWTLNDLPPETVCITNSTERFLITNVGNVTGTLGLQNIAEPGNTWMPAYYPSVMQYYLGARFNDNDTPPTSDEFQTWIDIIPRTHIGWCGTGAYGGGYRIPPNNPAIPGLDPTERLWLKFQAPQYFGTETSEIVRVRVFFQAAMP